MATAKGTKTAEDAVKDEKGKGTPASLPSMEDRGDSKLEGLAIDHEDNKAAIKILNNKQNTIKAELTAIMKKKGLDTYSHKGFELERQNKGETVKVKSIPSEKGDGKMGDNPNKVY